MVNNHIQHYPTPGFLARSAIVTAVAAAILAWLAWHGGDFTDLWRTPDQQGRYRYEQLEFAQAAERFEDPAWKAVALYQTGEYGKSAAVFGRIATAEGFFNRGNAFMRAREYGKAIIAYEQAVIDAPGWVAAQENLALARYILAYIERSREQSDTGDETELGADDYVFDNTRERGMEIVITQESTVEAASAEKWMRSVDTEIRDFLRTRFLLEASREISP